MATPKRAAASAARSKIVVDESDAPNDDDASFEGDSGSSSAEEQDSEFGEVSEDEKPKKKTTPKKSSRKSSKNVSSDEDEEEVEVKKEKKKTAKSDRKKSKNTDSEDEQEKPKSAKKKRKSRADSDEEEEVAASEDDEEEEEPPKKKKKDKKSGGGRRASTNVNLAGTAPTIPQSMLNFLDQLDKNNNREWFHARKNEFDAMKKNFERFAGFVLQSVRNEFDPTIKDVEGKDALYRIHRDVRFGGLPYKPLMSFAFSRNGRKGDEKAAVYYVHVQPGGKSFVGGGIWQPAGPIINKIRDQVAEKTDEGKTLRKLVTKSESFRETFGNTLIDSGDEAEDIAPSYRKSLKTAPKGFAKDHKYIELLRLKSWTVGHKLKDSDVTSPEFAREVIRICGEMSPFIQALNNVLDA